MSRSFDTKFGPSFAQDLPTAPGIYIFRDSTDQVIYVGKAKNLRRRLQCYRRANSRKKKERKMRLIIRSASHLSFEVCDSALSALLRENELIQSHHPPFNVAGAYSFMYPYLGIKIETHRPRQLCLCCTTQPDLLMALGFELFGAYRCKMATKSTYLALIHLLSYFTQVDPAERKTLGTIPFTRIQCLRQLNLFCADELRAFLRGESQQLPHTLFTSLLEKASARRDAATIQLEFALLRDFFQKEAKTLRQAMSSAGIVTSWIAGAQRDPLFIKTRSAV